MKANQERKSRIEAILRCHPLGCYIDMECPGIGFRAYADLDGAHAANFLREAGYEVTHWGDQGTNGLALTACHVILSTNGFIFRSDK